MLSDFLTLEVYFGSDNAALYFEDLVKNYGRKRARQAIRDGDLKYRLLCSDASKTSPRILTWLSEQGRNKARAAIS